MKKIIDGFKMIFILILGIFILVIPEYLDFSIIDNETKFWFFSAASQSLAAMVVLLFTGYIFYIDGLDRIYGSIEEYDYIGSVDSHEGTLLLLKKDSHDQISEIAVISGIAIIFSLALIITNKTVKNNLVYSLEIFTLIIIILSIFLAVKFILITTDPKRVNTVIEEYFKLEYGKINNENYVEIGIFIEEFIKFEKYIKVKYREKYGSTELVGDSPFAEKIKAISRNDLILYDKLKEIKEIVNVRNMAIHGHSEKIPSLVYNELKSLNDKLE